MTPPQLILLTFALLEQAVFPLFTAAASNVTYPPPYGLDQSWTGAATSVANDLLPVQREVYGGGRIINISHRYHPDMPMWESPDGIGNFFWLAKSMKNGSLTNNSEIKLSTNTRTHVDAPGHIFNHYFDADVDVDTLNLDVLNITVQSVG